MSEYFNLVSQDLFLKLSQVKHFIKKHNPTIGVLTEEIVKSFLKNHLPKTVNVEQGFIQFKNGEISKQCDIIIYDCHSYSPIYRINDIVIVPSNSVIAVIEIKTTISKTIFHSVIDYYQSFEYLKNAKTYLFIFNAGKRKNISSYFETYKHPGSYQSFDHDTFQKLPDVITGINESYTFKKDLIVTDRDCFGYSYYHYENLDGSEIGALQLFYESIEAHVCRYIEDNYKKIKYEKENNKEKRKIMSIYGIQLFDS